MRKYIIQWRLQIVFDFPIGTKIWLALRNITADGGRSAKDWKEAMNQFVILYVERFERARG